ncbi:MAG: glyoxalase [Bacteroidetes bacterium]|nr:glyoxalase [Bacteroidota bacterium]MBU1372883.1 glyoxalase [Bacteroidota bacterium]MBU1485612.1 glyoxalase [Bacteroidota bacterium]MBU1761437.1 glyoxalase [Bacteroidota bacterium]MBU2268903.1 glyoxalase [Bacteroidota bacterium]
MKSQIKSLRPFIGAKNFEESRNFYQDLGFQETVLAHNLSVFKLHDLAFYLQDAYVKDWVDNTMIFLEVDDVDDYWKQLQKLDLMSKYADVKLVPVKSYDWGNECFIHDPSGILWHIGTFN